MIRELFYISILKKELLKSELSILEKEKPENFFKLYQMDGYCLNEIYQDIDRDMDNESDIIKVKLKKDGSLIKMQNSYLKKI